jgi:hypothetical protein
MWTAIDPFGTITDRFDTLSAINVGFVSDMFVCHEFYISILTQSHRRESWASMRATAP